MEKGCKQFPGFVLDFFKNNKLLFFSLFVFFILRIPTLFEPHRYADEEIYLALGQGLRKGLVFYRDIHDNKPPLLYFVAAIAGNVFWFRLILLFTHALGVIYFWKLATLIFKNSKIAVFLSSFCFGLLSTIPAFEGNIANGENFMIVPALIAVFLLYRALDNHNFDKNWIYPSIGCLFAVAFLFKVPIIFDFVGILMFWIAFSDNSFSPIKIIKKLFSKKFWLVMIGFLLPIVLSTVYYAVNGAYEPYFRSALLQNIGYLSSWSGGGGNMFSNPLIWRGLVIITIVSALIPLKKLISSESVFLVLWAIFSMYGALLSSRPYPHYLLEPLAPISLLITLIVFEKKWLSKIFSVIICVLIILAYNQVDFWRYESLPYYKNFIDYATNSKSWEEYIDFLDAKQNYQIAEYIKERSQGEKYLFVWGTEPAIYVLTDLLPVGRYTVAYHVVDFKASEVTIEALKNTPPKYIVTFDNAPDFQELFSLLEAEYVMEKRFESANIFRRK